MISDEEIYSKAKEFELGPLDVQKDYVYSRRRLKIKRGSRGNKCPTICNLPSNARRPMAN